MTHAELVNRAVKWLRNTMRCAVVISECGGGLEIPDAIGFQYSGRSILVECKTSRSDFLNDRHKPSRRVPSLGLGMLRYYMAQPGIISPNELLRPWGLCAVHPKQIRIIKEPELLIDEIGSWRERQLLISSLAKNQNIKKPGD